MKALALATAIALAGCVGAQPAPLPVCREVAVTEYNTTIGKVYVLTEADVAALVRESARMATGQRRVKTEEATV